MANEVIKKEPIITDKELLAHLTNLGLVNKLTPGEKDTFLQIAKAYNLNPFKREIHVSKYGDQMSIITGYEVYIKRAERSGMLNGWEIKTSGSVQGGDLKATIKIHRKDWANPFTWEVLYTEYVQTVKDNNTNSYRPNKFWQKAETMTKKVAIAQGFRLCFSDELGGMPYTGDEINGEMNDPQDTGHIVVPTPADAQPVKAQPIQTQSITDKAIAAAANRILGGETDLHEKTLASFAVTDAQKEVLDCALENYKNKQTPNE